MWFIQFFSFKKKKNNNPRYISQSVKTTVIRNTTIHSSMYKLGKKKVKSKFITKEEESHNKRSMFCTFNCIL